MSYQTHSDPLQKHAVAPAAVGAIVGGGLGSLVGLATAEKRHQLRDLLAGGAIGAGIGGGAGMALSSDNSTAKALTAMGLGGGVLGFLGGTYASGQGIRDTRGLRQAPVTFSSNKPSEVAQRVEEEDESQELDTRDSFKAANEGGGRGWNWMSRGAVLYRSLLAAGVLGGYGGYRVGRPLVDRFRKERMLDELRKAEDDLDEALAEQRTAFELRREKLGHEKAASLGELGAGGLALLTTGSLGVGALTYHLALKRMRKNDKHRQAIQALSDYEKLEKDRYLGDIEDRISSRF